MCGIAGFITNRYVDAGILGDMTNALRHRGPDDTGFYTGSFDAAGTGAVLGTGAGTGTVAGTGAVLGTGAAAGTGTVTVTGTGTGMYLGLGHCRLGIMDPENGKQPVMNEDESVIVVFNGEIYNHQQLRNALARRGHIMANRSDSAILPHMYEEYGTDMFIMLNGQFAMAIWVKTDKKLILARDRLGEKPLYYFCNSRGLCFGSEAKAIFKSGMIKPEISPVAIKQIFTFWTTLSGASIFQGIYQLPSGCFLIYRNGAAGISRYWELSYSGFRKAENTSAEEIEYEVEQKLRSSIKMRLMSDVPISFYLSGGLDSSLVASMAAGMTDQEMKTFSVAFEDKNYDESDYQDIMVKHLGTNHHKVHFSLQDIPSVMREVLTHTEMPLLRSGAFPMYILAGLVRQNNIKVALSGEGADELFGGYDIFREVKIREFCSRFPDSKKRASLYKKVNRFVQGLEKQPASSLSLFYNSGGVSIRFGSHEARWRLGSYSRNLFSPEYSEQMEKADVIGQLEELLPEDFVEWTPLQRAQYLEIIIFFTNYLLSSQGDRVSMACGVECRYPFLDYRLLEYSCGIPDNMKIKALNEKYIIKKIAARYLPKEILNRKKFPYRAPISISRLMENEYVRELVGRSRLKRYGIFEPGSVERMVSAALSRTLPSERDSMLFMGILTTQMAHEIFIG